MFEQQHILNKIEYWIEKLPYQSVKIDIKMENQNLMLEKTSKNPIGFQISKLEGGEKGVERH